MDNSNIGAMLSQLKGQAAYSGHSMPVSGKQAQSAEALLKSMEPGQVFSGEITDIRGSYITITLQNMQSIQARLAENFEFLIGQKAMFQVKENLDNQLLIRPMAMDAAQNGELMVAERALEAAGIQMTEKTLELVKNLLAANQPIDKQSILSYIRQLAKYPQADMQDIISLNKFHMPINEENLNQLSNYKQFEHSLVKEIVSMEEQLPQVIEKMAAESPEKAETFLKDLTEILYPKEEQTALKMEEQGKEQQIPDGIIKNVLEQESTEKRTDTAINRQELPVQEAANPVKNDQAGLPSKEELPDLLKELPQIIEKEGKEKAGKIIKQALEEKFLLKPEEVADKEKVKEFYESVAKKGEKLKDLFASHGKEMAQLEKPVQNLTQNVKFMNSLNEMFTYIQLPLKMANKQAHADLYVYTKKKAKGNAKDGLSAFLHLDMENLGSVDVLIRMMGQRVTTNFTLETVELLDFIEGHMDLLEERLGKKGYSCSAKMMLKGSEEQKKSFEQCLTGEAELYSDRKRFSFDVRA